MIQRCLRCGGGARNPICAKCRRVVGNVQTKAELDLGDAENALIEADNAFIEKVAADRYPGAAAISAFLPGIGQLMKGQILKAIGIWFGYAVCLLLLFLGGLVLMLILWLAQIDDAYRMPDRWARQKLLEIKARRGW